MYLSQLFSTFNLSSLFLPYTLFDRLGTWSVTAKDLHLVTLIYELKNYKINTSEYTILVVKTMN